MPICAGRRAPFSIAMTTETTLSSAEPSTNHTDVPVRRSFWTWLPWAHLAVSAAIAATMAALVYGFWFAPPMHQLAGGMPLFGWIILVDVVCGPLLTWLLIKPHKTRRALAVDGALIVCLQLTALGYGLYTLAHARPLAIVYEVDRFRVLSYADLPESELGAAPSWFQPWGAQTPRLVGLREARDLEEKMASVDAALQGVDTAQHPARWQDYELNRAQVLERARPLTELRARYPLDAGLIDTAVQQAGLSVDQTIWLPVTSRRNNGWVALMEPGQGRIVGYLPLDGFF